MHMLLVCILYRLFVPIQLLSLSQRHQLLVHTEGLDLHIGVQVLPSRFSLVLRRLSVLPPFIEMVYLS